MNEIITLLHLISFSSKKKKKKKKKEEEEEEEEERSIYNFYTRLTAMFCQLMRCKNEASPK